MELHRTRVTPSNGNLHNCIHWAHILRSSCSARVVGSWFESISKFSVAPGWKRVQSSGARVLFLGTVVIVDNFLIDKIGRRSGSVIWPGNESSPILGARIIASPIAIAASACPHAVATCHLGWRLAVGARHSQSSTRLHPHRVSQHITGGRIRATKRRPGSAPKSQQPVP